MLNDNNKFFLSKNNKPITSSMMFTNTNQNSPPIRQINFTLICQKRQILQASSSILNSSRKGLAVKSMIFSQNSQPYNKKQDLSKLDSLARHVVSNSSEDLLCDNINNLPKTQMKKQLSEKQKFIENFKKSNQSKQTYHQYQKENKVKISIESFQFQNRRKLQFKGYQNNQITNNRSVKKLQFSNKNINILNQKSTKFSSSQNEFFKNKNINFFKKKHQNKQSIQSFNQLYDKTIKKIDHLQNQQKRQLVQQIVKQKQNIQCSNNNILSSFQSTLINKQLKLTNKSPPFRQITIEDFQIKDKIGKGAFGDVYLAQQKKIGFVCVLKKMSKKYIKQAKVEQHIIRQIKLQSYLNHRHITSIYGYFHDDQYIYLIIQLLAEGSLQQIKKKKKIPQKQTANYIKQIAAGLKYMHGQQVIHRDLKPQNIFVHQELLKIGDFGCSIFHNDTSLRNTVVGCLQYFSPQQLSKQGYNIKIDSWSLGIMTYELLFGKSPFQNQIKKIMSNQDKKTQLPQIYFPPSVPIKQQTKQFILNLLSPNPDDRMDMDAVLFHPFLRN